MEKNDGVNGDSQLFFYITWVYQGWL